ncbi:hypothetical protein M422DRAFT_267198 [Sphaerobolus stellatus SS14]|uniref:Uncharacterized protein n=1 Tax=Sphaerobolus stellatus (strain SS14) TaxID=990650 RepID=A0A0C9UQ10_SPHS4|nr:hypothetical protein M422DRAFT_267198 [Sphaerobolus stellatus SS14]
MSAPAPQQSEAESLMASEYSQNTIEEHKYPPEIEPSSLEPPAKPYVSTRLAIADAIHAFMVAVHILLLMAYFMKWHINTSLIQVTSLQTGVTAILHTFLAITLASGFVSDLVEVPTLGVLHLHMNAWAGLLSSFRSSWNFFRASPSEIDSHGLRRIFFYLGACTLLQISSSSIFVLNLNADEPSTTLLDYFSPFILQGSCFGDFDTLWPSGIKITSSDRDVFPPAAEISDAHISTFTLPYPSSDLSLAKPSPDGCLFQKTTDDEGVWLNFSMPAPPYWDPSAPGLNFTAYWGLNEAVTLPSTLRMNY